MTTNAPQRFRVVLASPGPDKMRQSAVISEHPTATAAFAAIDRLALHVRGDSVELIVVDQAGRIVHRLVR